MIHTSVFNSVSHKHNLSVVKMELNYDRLTSTSTLDGLNQETKCQHHFCTLSKKQTICLAVAFGILLIIAILGIVVIGVIFAGAMNVAQH